MITWGDYPYNKAECRIMFQNVNGISPKGQFAKAHMLSIEATFRSVDILCLAECILDWTYKSTENTCKSIFRKYWKQTKIAVNNSTENFGKIYQPGGVCTIVGDKWANQSEQANEQSNLGRWNETIIRGRNNRKVAIITAYNVCKNNIATAGSMTAYYQQWHILHRQNKYDKIDPRIIMMEDLKQRIKILENNGTEVILCIDANDSLQNTNSELSKWLKTSNLIDVLVDRHGTDNEPATCSRDTQRIGYIFTSPNLVKYVVDVTAGILPLHELCLSDHRSVYIDLELKKYLKGDIPTAQLNSNRKLTSDDGRIVKEYQRLLTVELNKSNLEERIKILEEKHMKRFNKIEICTEIEELDHVFTNIKLNSEENCIVQYKHPWSPKLQKA